MDGLSPKQRETLRAFADWQLACGRPPTLAELADSLGIARVSAHGRVQTLLEKRKLVAGPAKANRRYRIPARQLQLYALADTRALVRMWGRAPDDVRAEFANLVMTWWAHKGSADDEQ